MKRIFLFTAIVLAGVMAGVVQAQDGVDLNFYGNFRYSLNKVDEDGGGLQLDGLQATDNISLFGMKGRWGNESISAFIHLETQAFADNDRAGKALKQRLYYGGLEGKWGRISMGRMTNAYKAPGFRMDPFYNYSHIGVTGTYANGGGTFGLSRATNGFTDNTIQYDSPAVSHLTLTGSIIVDDSNDNGHGYIMGGVFARKGVSVGVVYAMNHEDLTTIPGIDVDSHGIRAYVAGKLSQIDFGASWELLNISGEDISHLYLTTTAKFDEAQTDVAVSAGMYTGGVAEGFALTAGVFKTLLPKTQAFVIFSFASLEADVSPRVISLGLNAAFDVAVSR